MVHSHLPRAQATCHPPGFPSRSGPPTFVSTSLLEVSGKLVLTYAFRNVKGVALKMCARISYQLENSHGVRV